MELVADIAAHGLRHLIALTPDGRILHGRNRWRACARLGITLATCVEDGETWALVMSENMHRRHLSASQLAMVAPTFVSC